MKTFLTKTKLSSKNKMGQILLELIWLIVFVAGFLSSVFYLYQKGEKEINKYRLNQEPVNEKQYSSMG